MRKYEIEIDGGAPYIARGRTPAGALARFCEANDLPDAASLLDKWRASEITVYLHRGRFRRRWEKTVRTDGAGRIHDA